MRAESADHRSAGLSAGLDVRRSSGIWWDDDCVGWRIGCSRRLAGDGPLGGGGDDGLLKACRAGHGVAEHLRPPVTASMRPTAAVWRLAPPNSPGAPGWRDRPVRRPLASGSPRCGADGQAAAQVGSFNLALVEPASRVRHLDAAPTGRTITARGRHPPHTGPPGRSRLPPPLGSRSGGRGRSRRRRAGRGSRCAWGRRGRPGRRVRGGRSHWLRVWSGL